MPTAFRSQPINYAATEIFNDNLSEMMFFGVSGYEVETLLAEGADSFDDKNMLMHPDLTMPIDMKLSQTSLEDPEMSEIGNIQEIQISSVRTAS